MAPKKLHKIKRFLILVVLLAVSPIVVSYIPCETSGGCRVVISAAEKYRGYLCEQAANVTHILSDKAVAEFRKRGGLPGKAEASALEGKYLELPRYEGEVVEHASYTLKYSEMREQPVWVAYQLTEDEVKHSIKRTDDFRPDPAVKTGSATLADYRGSGYDRGHLCPAADNRWSEQAMSESFFMSNMSPQSPGLNRGVWSTLEGDVRDWAVKNHEIYVVCGGVFQEGKKYKKIGKNGVSVPDYYYKVVLDYKEPDLKAIGFVFPNMKCSRSPGKYVQSIDAVEQLTGLDFFPMLNDVIEDELESHADWKRW